MSQNIPPESTNILSNTKETKKVVETPKKPEDIQREVEKNNKTLNDIASVLSEYEKNIIAIAQTVEDDLGKRFENNARDLQRFRAELFNAKNINLEKSKELIVKFESIHNDISENLQELNSISFSKEGIEARLRRARRENTQNQNIQIRENDEEELVTSDEEPAPVISTREPNYTQDLIATTQDDSESPEKSPPKYKSAVDEILGTSLDLTETFEKAKQKQVQLDEKNKTENKVSEILGLINSESEPKYASRLVRQLWDLMKNKLGNITSIVADSDNQNFIITDKNGIAKSFPPSAIQRFAGRSFKVFENNYLSKIKPIEAKVINFGSDSKKSDTRIQTENKPNLDFSKLSSRVGHDVLVQGLNPDLDIKKKEEKEA